MWRIVCNLISGVTACALLLGSLACCSRDNSSRALQQRLFLKGILTENNITVTTVEEQDDNLVSAEYIQIDGLKHQETEDRINRRLRETFDSMYQGEFIPPYRGISVKLRQCKDSVKSLYIFPQAQFNCNHILSVSFYCYVSYSTPDDEEEDTGFGYSYEVPLNFDLTTGEELTLKDLFQPGADYLELINGAVDRQFLKTGFDGDTEGAAFEMTSPFQGISPDQKFYVSTNGELILLFDYDTPEFYTGFYPLTMTVRSEEWEEELRLFQTASDALYESEEPIYRLIADEALDDNERSVQINPHEHFFGVYNYQKDTPEPTLQSVESLAFDQTLLSDKLDDIFGQMQRQYGDSDWSLDINCLMQCNPVRLDGYYNYTRYYSYYASADMAWETEDTPDLYQAYSTKYCLDENGQSREWTSLFHEPEQAPALIEAAMVKALCDDWDADKETATEIAEMLIPHIDGVNVCVDCLELSYDLTEKQILEMSAEITGNSDEGYSYYWSASRPSYRNIGCQHLNFFHE